MLTISTPNIPKFDQGLIEAEVRTKTYVDRPVIDWINTSSSNLSNSAMWTVQRILELGTVSLLPANSPSAPKVSFSIPNFESKSPASFYIC
jgi:hypothetical protein